jgi:hypothetical protein
MDDKEQTKAFAGDLDALVERYRSEFDLTYAVVIGVLYLKAHMMAEEASETTEEE